MKKFIITEEEKNRILGMHKKATSNFYLNEQEDGLSISIQLGGKVYYLELNQYDGHPEGMIFDGTYRGTSEEKYFLFNCAKGTLSEFFLSDDSDDDEEVDYEDKTFGGKVLYKVISAFKSKKPGSELGRKGRTFKVVDADIQKLKSAANCGGTSSQDDQEPEENDD